jgi:hypothetical protein
MSREDNLIKFAKGHKPLPPNPEKMKAKKRLKELLTEFSVDCYEEFLEEFHKLKGKPKCDIYLKAIEFVQPRIASISFEDLKESSSAMQLLKNFSKYRDQEE